MVGIAGPPSIGLTYSGLIRTLVLVAVVYAATAGLAGAAIALVA